MIDAEIRLEILKYLHTRAKKDPYGWVSKKDILSKLGINENALDFNSKYLEDKGLMK